MVRTLKELELLINEELAHVQEWLMLNKLTLNVKSQISLFSNLTKGSWQNMSLKLNNEMLQCIDNTKFLRIILDQHLTWKNHISYVTKTIIRTTGVLCRIRFYISQPLLRMLYYSLIYHNFIMEISYGLILIQSDWKTCLNYNRKY